MSAEADSDPIPVLAGENWIFGTGGGKLLFISPAPDSVQERDDLASRTRHAVLEGAVRISFCDAQRAAPQDGGAVGGGQLVLERADI